MNPPLIQMQNMTKIYKSGETVLAAVHSVDLEIKQGEFIAIMGPSGAGKSTLLHLMGCLDTPTEGDYFLDGENVSDLSAEELAVVRNRKIGFVFQDFDLLPNLTAAENVALPLIYGGIRESEALERALKTLELVDLTPRADFYPYQLSGGQQQRVAIARATVTGPLIVLADEPTGNLDTGTSKVILDLFTQLNEGMGTTVVIVTHEHAVAERAHRCVEIRDGDLSELVLNGEGA